MGLRGLHQQAVVLHAPGKPPWPASSIRMFGSCDPPFTLPHSPVPLYTRSWGSNGKPERDLPPRSEGSRQLLAQWQDPRRCAWCAGGGEVTEGQAGLGLQGPAVLPSGNTLADQAGSRHKHSAPGARAPGSLLQRWAHLFLLTAANAPCLGQGRAAEKESAGTLGAGRLGGVRCSSPVSSGPGCLFLWDMVR